jgi:hypothetical protein
MFTFTGSSKLQRFSMAVCCAALASCGGGDSADPAAASANLSAGFTATDGSVAPGAVGPGGLGIGHDEPGRQMPMA